MAPQSIRSAIGRSDRTLRQSYDKRVAEVRMMADPPVAQARLTESLGTLPSHAPQLAAAIGAKATAVASYLQSKVPPPIAPPSTLQPQFKGPPPSDSEMSSFLRVAAILDKPLGAIDELKKGRLQQDQVDALQACYPQLYGAMQKAVVDAVSNRRSELPYAKRKQLGILMGVPTDPTLEPDFIASMQASYPKEGPTPDNEGRAKMHSNAKLDLTSTATDTEAVAAHMNAT